MLVENLWSYDNGELEKCVEVIATTTGNGNRLWQLAAKTKILIAELGLRQNGSVEILTTNNVTYCCFSINLARAYPGVLEYGPQNQGTCGKRGVLSLHNTLCCGYSYLLMFLLTLLTSLVSNLD